MKHTTMQVKQRVVLWQIKSVKQSHSIPHAYFTEYLMSVTENSPQEYNYNPKNLRL
jgi:hypothetical protein